MSENYRIALVMTLALFIVSCGGKQNLAGQTDAAESTDCTAVDSGQVRQTLLKVQTVRQWIPSMP